MPKKTRGGNSLTKTTEHKQMQNMQKDLRKT